MRHIIMLVKCFPTRINSISFVLYCWQALIVIPPTIRYISKRDSSCLFGSHAPTGALCGQPVNLLVTPQPPIVWIECLYRYFLAVSQLRSPPSLHPIRTGFLSFAAIINVYIPLWVQSYDRRWSDKNFSLILSWLKYFTTVKTKEIPRLIPVLECRRPMFIWILWIRVLRCGAYCQFPWRNCWCWYFPRHRVLSQLKHTTMFARVGVGLYLQVDNIRCGNVTLYLWIIVTNFVFIRPNRASNVRMDTTTCLWMRVSTLMQYKSC